MTLFMSKLMSGILELLIVSVIPFITWLIWSRKRVGFFDWIGLKKVESQDSGYSRSGRQWQDVRCATSDRLSSVP